MLHSRFQNLIHLLIVILVIFTLSGHIRILTRAIHAFAGKEMRKYGASKDTDMAWESEDDKDDEVEGELNSGDKKVCEAFSILRREFYIKFQRMCV